MISVIPCRDEPKISELFKKHNIDVDEYSGCVIAESDDVVLGYSLYKLTSKTITIFIVEPLNDIPLADGILRSALHVAAENFVFDAFYDKCAPLDLFHKLGFVKNEDERRLDIDKLFGGCNCKK